MKFTEETKKHLVQVLDRVDTPAYVYIPSYIQKRIALLNDACGGFSPRYAVKANPNPNLLKWLNGNIKTLDISSSGELKLALSCGWEASALEFTGPAKKRSDIALAISSGVGSIVVEDLSEAQLIEEIASQKNKRVRILIRLAPETSEKGFAIRLAGRATQFGVDAKQLIELWQHLKDMSHLHLAGFHIYSGSQCLDGEAMIEHFEMLWQEFKQAITVCDIPVEELVFGAGMGIPYHDNDSPLNIAVLRSTCQRIRQEMNDVLPNASAFLEIGRYLVGEAGFFLTQVIRTKQSKGKNIVICDGGMNHNLAACGLMGGIGHRHYSMINLTSSSKKVEEYKIVGPLCTAIDTLAQRVHLTETKAGDILAIGCAGAYGPSSSPIYFISHTAPNEAAVMEADNEYTLQDWSWLTSTPM